MEGLKILITQRKKNSDKRGLQKTGNDMESVRNEGLPEKSGVD
jgi:hypothetical protein